ncbi:MAG: PAS domain S-box protein [Desulfobacteraceae bacterium]|nr:PAS domain S-box protein [Desulfobacteraceae bacterium]
MRDRDNARDNPDRRLGQDAEGDSQSEQEKKDLSLICEVGQLFSSSLELERVFQEVCRRCVETLDVDLCLLRLVENGLLIVRGNFFRHPAEKKNVEKLLAENPIHVGEGIAGKAVLAGEPVMSDNVPVELQTLPGYVEYLQRRKWLLIPLKVKELVIGVLTFITGDPIRRFSQRDITLAQGIANQAAIAIENARLFDTVERSGRLYRTILESSADAILSLDSDLKIRAWSAGAERIFGYTKEEIIGQQLEILVPEHELSTVAEKQEEVRQKGFIRGWETQRRAKDGRLVDVEITLNYLGPEMGSTGIMRDITERKKAQIALYKANEELYSLTQQLEKKVLERTTELEEKNRELVAAERLAAMGEMANRIAHDLRNSLTVVGGFALRINRATPEDDPKKKYLELITHEVRVLEKKVSDIIKIKDE